MKILLLGEFSALHTNLKEGLNELGHKAVVAGTGDGFKKIPVDICFDSNKPGALGKLFRKLKPISSLGKLKNFDVVQLINPFVFHQKFFPAEFFYNHINRNNSKFFLLAAGDDAYFWRYGRKALKYGPFDDFLKYDLGTEDYYKSSDSALLFNDKVIALSKAIIPIMHEYEVSYFDHPKRAPTIPIPINTDKVDYLDNNVKSKVVVFHGLNRYGFKGTRHVEKAFEYLSNRYPNDLELIIDGKMPLKEYLELMGRTNVIIDQVYSHSLGVNGVYALAMGKVVLGGAEPESFKSLGVDSSPVINLKPNASSIIEEVEKLLDNRGQIPELGLKSREFAEKVHGHIKVAEQYIETWNRY